MNRFFLICHPRCITETHGIIQDRVRDTTTSDALPVRESNPVGFQSQQSTHGSLIPGHTTCATKITYIFDTHDTYWNNR